MTENQHRTTGVIVNIVLLILCVGACIYYINSQDNPTGVATNSIRIHDTIYITIPADTIVLKSIKTKTITLREIDTLIKVDSTKVLELTNNIDSLNNELLINNIERIAELDTIIGKYEDRLNVLYSINKNKWDINMIYSERNLKQVYNANILIPVEQKSDFELFISRNPFLSLVLSGAVGFTIGSIF